MQPKSTFQGRLEVHMTTPTSLGLFFDRRAAEKKLGLWPELLSLLWSFIFLEFCCCMFCFWDVKEEGAGAVVSLAPAPCHTSPSRLCCWEWCRWARGSAILGSPLCDLPVRRSPQNPGSRSWDLASTTGSRVWEGKGYCILRSIYLVALG